LIDDFAVFASMFSMARRGLMIRTHHRLTRLIVLHHSAKDRGFDVVPFDIIGLRDGDKVDAKEHARDAFNSEDALRKR